MKIYFLSLNAKHAARCMADHHIQGMLGNYAQLLSNAIHYFKDRLPQSIQEQAEDLLYAPQQEDHKVSVWVGESFMNFRWLFFLTDSIREEYTRRNGTESNPDPLQRKPFEVLAWIAQNSQILGESMLNREGLTPPWIKIPRDQWIEDHGDDHDGYFRLMDGMNFHNVYMEDEEKSMSKVDHHVEGSKGDYDEKMKQKKLLTNMVRCFRSMYKDEMRIYTRQHNISIGDCYKRTEVPKFLRDLEKIVITDTPKVIDTGGVFNKFKSLWN